MGYLLQNKNISMSCKSCMIYIHTIHHRYIINNFFNKMASAMLVQELIYYQSIKMDQQYADIFGPTHFYERQTYQETSVVDQSQSTFNLDADYEQESSGMVSCSFEQTRHQTPPLNLPNKRKMINKSSGIRFQTRSLEDEMESDQETPVRRHYRHKKRRGNKEGYPTKNFLPNFKGPHIQFLYKQLGQSYVDTFQIIQIMKDKNGVSMKDYQTLYKVEEFQEALKKFFKEKVLYRQLMLSRSSMKARKVHIKKLAVFEKAFEEKSFDRIN